MFFDIKKELLDTGQFIENEYLFKYLNHIQIKYDNDNDNYYKNKHHIIPYHILKLKGISITDKKYLKTLSISDHIIAHYYLFKCSKTNEERCANINTLNLLLNKKLNKKYFELLSDEELINLAKARDCLYSFIKETNSSKNQGKIYIHKDNICRKIFPADLAIWEKQGWKKGGLKFSEEHKAKLRKKKPMSEDAKKRLKGRGAGKIKINKDGKIKTIDPESVKKYLDLGWSKGGKKHTKEEKEHLSKIFKNRPISDEQKKQISSTLKGYVTMHKDDREAHVYPSKINEFLLLGWEYGRAPKIKEKLKK